MNLIKDFSIEEDTISINYTQQVSVSAPAVSERLSVPLKDIVAICHLGFTSYLRAYQLELHYGEGAILFTEDKGEVLEELFLTVDNYLQSGVAN